MQCNVPCRHDSHLTRKREWLRPTAGRVSSAAPPGAGCGRAHCSGRSSPSHPSPYTSTASRTPMRRSVRHRIIGYLILTPRPWASPGPGRFLPRLPAGQEAGQRHWREDDEASNLQVQLECEHDPPFCGRSANSNDDQMEELELLGAQIEEANNNNPSLKNGLSKLT
jgi:hypothetical protein